MECIAKLKFLNSHWPIGMYFDKLLPQYLSSSNASRKLSNLCHLEMGKLLMVIINH